MFTTRATTGRDSGRFTLLLLDDGEDYVDDWVAVAHWPPDVAAAGGAPPPTAPVPGRLRLASRSLLFDADDGRLPIIRLPFAAATSLEPGPGGHSIQVASTLAIRMKAGGVDAPFEFDKSGAPRSWTFDLPYAPLADVLPPAAHYLALSRLPRAELPAALAAAAAERAAAAAFDPSRLVDFSERLALDLPARLLSPLVGEAGRFAMTDTRIYFEPLHLGAGGGPRTAPLAGVVAAAPRRCSVADVGLELFFAPTAAPPGRGPVWGTPSALFAFESPAVRDRVAAALARAPALGGAVPGGAPAAAAATAALTTPSGRAAVTSLWRHGALSNLDYLLFVNAAASRSWNDVSRWPVAPWVVAEYDCASMDAATPLRDLSRPMGALSESRLAALRARMDAMPPGDGPDAPFLYGSFYSTPAFVMHWLLRAAPGHLLRLQGGRFDAPDRLFWSVADAWASASGGGSGADVRELTPEFFLDDAAFLVNTARLPLGARQDGTPVDDVVLPAWAGGDAAGFLRAHRAALESRAVSANLHHWLDLIYGVKQKGPAALAADNVFFPLTYGSVVEAAAASAAGDARASAALAAQVNEFGQCPSAIFEASHPRRLVSPPWAEDDDWWSRGDAAAAARDRVGGARGAARTAALVARLGELLAGGGESRGTVEEDGGLDELDVLREEERVVAAAPPAVERLAATPPPPSASPVPPPTGATSPSSSSLSAPSSRWTTITSLASSAAAVAAAAASSGAAGNDGLKASLRGLFGRGGGGDTASRPSQASPPPPQRWPPVRADIAARLEGRAPTVIASDLLAPSATSLAAATRHTDGALLVYAGGGTGQLGVWVGPARARAHRVAPAGTGVTALALLRPPAGRDGGLPLALAGCGDGRLVAYSADAGGVAGARVGAHTDALSALAVGGASLMSAGWDGAVRLWSLADGRHPWAKSSPPPTLERGCGAPVWCAALTADARTLAAGTDDGVVRVWDMRSAGDAPVLTLTAGDDYVAGVGFVEGAAELCLATACGSTLATLDARAPASPPTASIALPAALRCACVSGGVVAAGTDSGGVALWTPGDSPPVIDARPGAGVAAVALVGGGEGRDDAVVTVHDDGGVVAVVG